MTIKDLKSLYHLHQIEDPIEIHKVKNMLNATDLIKSDAISFYQVIDTIEKSINLVASRENLKSFLLRTQLNSDFKKGIEILYELMDMSGYITLKKYSDKLFESLSKNTSKPEYLEYKESQHPYLRIFKEHFEIKEIENSTYNSFQFSEITAIKLQAPEERISFFWHTGQHLMAKAMGKFELILFLKNGKQEVIYTKNPPSNLFSQFIEKIQLGISDGTYDFSLEEWN